VKTDTLLAMAWLLCLAGFVALGVYVAGRDSPGVDLDVATAIQDLPDAFDPLFDGSNWLGAGWPLTVVTLGVGLVFIQRGAVFEAILINLTQFPRVINGAVKDLFEAPRPSPTQIDVSAFLDSFGFPSGHVLGTTLVFVMLFIFASRLGLEERQTRLVQGFAVLMTAGVGLARVWTGAHWPSDVAGGYLFAALWLIAALRVYTLAQPHLVGRFAR
jgi:undecaprenyl-diphosphatase